MDPKSLTRYLDEYFDVPAHPDYPGAMNGLQVECRRDIGRVALAVDACLYTIEEAASFQADILIVHHGLFWAPITPLMGMQYRRIAALIRAEVGLYSVHLPLDSHPEVGNNHVLCRRLGLQPDGRWAAFEGHPVGVTGCSSATVGEMLLRVESTLGVQARLVGSPQAAASRIGIVTGAGSEHLREALELGLDLLITGEATHHSALLAEELGVHMILAGHYATETVGIQELGTHIEGRLGLSTVFIDHPTGL